MDDKKKKLAIIGLLVAICAIGAFQFSSGGDEPPATAKTDTKSAVVAEKIYDVDQDAHTSIVAATALPARDPFDGSAWQPKPEQIKPTPEVPPKPTAFKPRSSGRGGVVRPFDVNLGGIPDINGSNVKFEQGKPAPAEAQFGYSVSGVITGAKPAIVIAEPGGIQRIVRLGAEIDGDSRVIGIEKGKVTIRFKNKTLTMNVGGTSSDK